MRRIRSRGSVLIAAILVAITVGLFAQTLASRVYSNAGMLVLRRARSHIPSGAEATTELSRAEALFRKALDLDNRNGAAYRGLALLFWEQGLTQQAGESWRLGGIQYEDFVRVGEQIARAGDLESALDWYRRAVAVAPERGDPYLDLGLLLAKMGLDEQALSDLDQAVELDSFPDASREVVAHSERARLLYKLGKMREAMTEYEWLIQRRPDDYWAHLRVGALAWELDRDVARAEAMLVRATQIDPAQKWAYSRLGDLYRDTDRPADALKMYLKVLEIDPDDQSARKRIQAIEAESPR